MNKENLTYAGGAGALSSSIKFILRDDFIKSSKSLLKLNQVKGCDCPGCAWPDPNPKERSFAEFCENGVKAITYETTKQRASKEFFANNKVKDLAKLEVYELSQKGRLCEPLSYNKQKDIYEAISWDKAFSLIAKHLKKLKTPDDAILYTSGRASNEAAFLYQLFGRLLGTNNFPDCSNMCHESSSVAMNKNIGVGKGTVELEDFKKAKLIMVFGQNPATNHPRMLASLQEARKNGAKILSFNPLKEAGLLGFIHPKDFKSMLFKTPSQISTHYYQVSLGSDMAVLQAVIFYILKHHKTKLDFEFIEKHCHGFEDYEKHILSQDFKNLVKHSSLSKKEIKEIADLYLESDKTICCWAMGLTQQEHGVASIEEVINLLLLKGNIGKSGAGACPVRGHSNVQGDRTVGIDEMPKEDFLKSIDKAFSFKSPRKHGVNVVNAIKVIAKEKNKVFIALGGNFAEAAPDSKLCYAALEACDLSVYISTHINKSHLLCGKSSLILPCLGRTEIDIQSSGKQSLSVEDSMSIVHSSQGRNKPISSFLKSESEIIAKIADATLGKNKIDFLDLISDYDKIREKIEEVLPIFKDYNKKIKNSSGFVLENLASKRIWNTDTKKANFSSNLIPNLKLNSKHLALMTMRSHDQFNTTVYAKDDRYRGIKNKRKIIFINPKDIELLGFKNGDLVDIYSHSKDNIRRSVKGFEIISYDIKQGCAGAYFPEANPLISIEHHDKKSFTPAYKFIDISLKNTK